MAKGSQPTHTVRAKTGRKDVEGKNIYMVIGAAWETDNGMSVKLSSIPVGFDGSVYVNPIREDDRE